MHETHQLEQAIFDSALELPAGERAAHLDRACGTDTELRRRVEALLNACGRTSDYLDEPAISNVTSGRTIVLTEKAGDTIGRYKLLQQIGEGGCGVVYMADQEEPVRRRVALKVIKLGMDTKSVIARFEAERQALAMMDHPNIAKVLDAGATEAGRPYFVMELVRGIKITDYCDQLKLSTRDRLALFICVCQAVQHAHQKGIIHRDLKPSNILVTEHDGRPVPKIIDFGIAKATTGHRLTDQTLFTAFEQFIGTPAYTSPEQAGLGGLDIDTRSDIYSLGVLLYELLTGGTPFSSDEFKRSAIDEVLRVIRENEPARPSARLTTLSERELTTVAQHRQIESARLPSVLRGDLDWIVMKCLEKDRTRRYETANGVASDIQRHLNQEPVLACPPGNVYRFRKMVRRNRLAFAAASAVAAALFVGLGVSTWMFVREREAKAEQARLRQHAETESAKSQQVARFLEDMLHGVGPSVALGRDTTLLREILDKTVERLGKELTNQPAVEAELRYTIGSVYENLGQYEKAEAMQRESLRLRRTVSGKPNLVASSLRQLAFVLMRRGNLSEAEAVARESLAIRQKLFPGTLATASSMETVGTILSRTESNADEAEKFLRDALSIERTLQETNYLSVTLHNLALLLQQRGKLADAELFYRESLAMERALFGNNHPKTAIVVLNLANLLDDRRQYVEADTLAREALPLNKKLFGEEHPMVVKTFETLAKVARHQSRYDEAERFQREALLLRKKLSGEEDASVAYSLDELGNLLEWQENHAEAEPIYREALAIRTKLNRSDVSSSILNVARVVWNQGKQAEAEALLQEVVPAGTEIMANQVDLLRRRGEFYARHSRWAEATADLTEVIKLKPAEHSAYWALSAVLLETGDAESYRQFCHKVLTQFQTTTSPSTAVNVAKQCLVVPGASTNLALVSKVVDFSVKNLNRNSTTRALIEYRKGNFQAAVHESQHVLEEMPIPGRAVEAHLFIAMSEACLGRSEAAWSAFDKAMDMNRTKLPPGKYGDLGPNYIDSLHVRALLREAEATLKEKLGRRESATK